MNPELQKSTNPLLARIRLPGEIHALPSRGLFYKDGELDPSVVNGEVQIHAMTTYEEIVMRSPDLLYSGDAVKTVISRCVPQVMKPEKLLAKDVDFIMLVLRKASYGDMFDIRYTHTCEKAQTNSYTVNLDEIIKRTKNIDPTTFAMQFTLKLDNNQIVKLSPIRYEGIIRMLQVTDKDLSIEKRQELLTNILLDWIISVDGIEDKAMIKQWLTAIPVHYAKSIENAIEGTQTNWGADFYQKIYCRDCKQTAEISTPINPLTFFM